MIAVLLSPYEKSFPLSVHLLIRMKHRVICVLLGFVTARERVAIFNTGVAVLRYMVRQTVSMLLNQYYSVRDEGDGIYVSVVSPAILAIQTSPGGITCINDAAAKLH